MGFVGHYRRLNPLYFYQVTGRIEAVGRIWLAVAPVLE